jgi:hypothetical protein
MNILKTLLINYIFNNIIMTKICQFDGCKKRRNIFITCKCDKHFCNLHRFSDQHNCTFDYATENKEHLKSTIRSAQHTKVELV